MHDPVVLGDDGPDSAQPVHLASNRNSIEPRQHLRAGYVDVLLSEVPKQAGRVC
jgi:hypothetical protein